MRIILGIDPGSRKCGYGLIDSAGNKLNYLASGVIKVESKNFPERLSIIFTELSQIIDQYHPQIAAVEEVFMGRNASSALKLGQARGAALVACSNKGVDVAEYSARKVKQALVGSGKADKHQMKSMITTLLRLDSVPQEDAADALSIAVCHANTEATMIKMSGISSRRRSGRYS